MTETTFTNARIATMQHGLEARPPLIDKEVVDLACRLPRALRLTRKKDGTSEGKRVLKRMLERRFRPEFVHRPNDFFTER